VTSVADIILIRLRGFRVDLRLVFPLWCGRLAIECGRWGLKAVLIRWWLEGGLISAACDTEAQFYLLGGFGARSYYSTAGLCGAG
jgi:hypothetical protein